MYNDTYSGISNMNGSVYAVLNSHLSVIILLCRCNKLSCLEGRDRRCGIGKDIRTFESVVVIVNDHGGPELPVHVTTLDGLDWALFSYKRYDWIKLENS